MTMKTKLFFVACSLFLASMVSAQKIKVLEGNLEVLKNEKTINVEFTYDNLKVGKFKTEDEYVTKKREVLGIYDALENKEIKKLKKDIDKALKES